MNKRTVKRLTLNRETLRSLDENTLRVAGAAPAPKSKVWSECETCGIACTAINCFPEA